jgi:hypothetical protein
LWRWWVVTAVMAICYLRESSELLSDSRLREVRTVCAWVDHSFIEVVALRRLMCGVNDGSMLLGWRQYYSCGDTVTEVKTFCSLGDDNFIEVVLCYWADKVLLLTWRRCVMKVTAVCYWGTTWSNIEKFTLSFILLHPVPFRCFSLWQKQNHFFETFLRFKKKDIKTDINFSHFISILEI